jgi:hypothetical protein
MKKDNRPFPPFEATNVSAERLENLSSYVNTSSSEPATGHKRRRLSDAVDDATPVDEDAPMKAESVAPVTTETTGTAAISNASSSHESADPRPVSPADSSATAKDPDPRSKIKPSTPSKLKKAGPSGLHRKKKPGDAHAHRSMKVPSAGNGGARQAAKASALAAPKRYRAKSPLGETTNFR